MTGMEWLTVPEPLKLTYDFITATNEARGAGVAIDTSQVLACKVANQAMRSYFARILAAVDRGEFDPDEIFDCEMAMGGSVDWGHGQDDDEEQRNDED